MSRALSNGLHFGAMVCLVGAVALAASYQLLLPGAVMLPAILALLPMIAALVVLARMRRVATSLAYLVIGTGSVLVYVYVFASQADDIELANPVNVALPKIALILVGGAGPAATAGLRWCIAGYLCAESAAVAAVLLAGGSPSFDVATGAAFAMFALLLTLTALAKRAAGRTRSALHRAAREELESSLRRRVELRATAMLHDTVLNHLTAIAEACPGPLDPKLAGQIERDLALLVGEDWLGDDSPQSAGGTSGSAAPVFAAIREATALGLNVETTGDATALEQLDPARGSELGLAVAQCLTNVLRHSGTSDAEVAIYASDAELLVMVVDTGIGFESSRTGPDRLGLKHSVVNRIESIGGSVQIWSTPGKGSSIVMRLQLAPSPPSPGVPEPSEEAR